MNIKQLLADTKLPIRVLAYRRASESARAITAYLKEKGYDCTLRAADPVNKPAVCISWGAHQVPVAHGSTVINELDYVRNASNKLTTLNILSDCGVPCPTYTTSATDAAEWLKDDGMIVCRHRLSAHSGTGIQIVGTNGDVYKCDSVQAPWYSARLFTRYFKRIAEYRVFAINGTAILARRKGSSTDIDPASRQYLVRTHATGWNFCEVELSDVPSPVLQAAVQAVAALGLHFGAVDVGWNEAKETACVFEVNTAPGMQGSTVGIFCEALLEADVSITHLPMRGAVVSAPRTFMVMDEALSAWGDRTMRRTQQTANVLVIPAEVIPGTILGTNRT